MPAGEAMDELTLAYATARQLEQLHRQWRNRYVVGVSDNGETWHAWRHGQPARVMTADTGDELLALLEADADAFDSEAMEVLYAERCENCGLTMDAHTGNRCPVATGVRRTLLFAFAGIAGVGIWAALIATFTHI